tara:strand:- start:1155 stop:2336 length:1182 start_codon:yes stop_codon:yes gene_type:complete
MITFKEYITESGKKAFMRNYDTMTLSNQERLQRHVFRLQNQRAYNSSLSTKAANNIDSEFLKFADVKKRREAAAMKSFETSVPRIGAEYIGNGLLEPGKTQFPDYIKNLPKQEKLRNQADWLKWRVSSEIPRDTPSDSRLFTTASGGFTRIHNWHPTAQKVYSRVRHLIRNGTIEATNPHGVALSYAKIVDFDTGRLDSTKPGVPEKMLRIASTGDEKLMGILQKHIESQDVKESLVYSSSDFLVENIKKDALLATRSMIDSAPIHFGELGDMSKQEISAGQALSRFHIYRILTANANHENLDENKLARVKNLMHDQILGNQDLIRRIGTHSHFIGKNRNSVKSAIGHVLSTYESEAPQNVMNAFKKNPASISIQPIIPETNINRHMVEFIKR